MIVTMARTRNRRPSHAREEEEEEENDDDMDDSNDCMKTMLATKDWILEEMQEGRIIPPPRADALHCYWLVQCETDHTLVVGKDALPEKETTSPGIAGFRLSLLEHGSNYTIVPLNNDGRDIRDCNVGTKMLFQDDLVRIWEFRLAPNARCHYHYHMFPYFFLNLTASQTQELDTQGNLLRHKPINHQTPGQCTFVTRDNLSSHAVLNVGSNVFLQFVVEFLSPKHAT